VRWWRFGNEMLRGLCNVIITATTACCAGKEGENGHERRAVAYIVGGAWMTSPVRHLHAPYLSGGIIILHSFQAARCVSSGALSASQRKAGLRCTLCILFGMKLWRHSLNKHSSAKESGGRGTWATGAV